MTFIHTGRLIVAPCGGNTNEVFHDNCKATVKKKVLRYRVGQRVVRNTGNLVSASCSPGSMILWPPMAGLAAGGTSGIIHRVGAILFMAVPILYLIVDRRGAKELLVESFTYDKDDLAWFKHMGQYFLGTPWACRRRPVERRAEVASRRRRDYVGHGGDFRHPHVVCQGQPRRRRSGDGGNDP